MNGLTVIHLRKGLAESAAIRAEIGARWERAFHLDSCQRWLWVTTDEATPVPGMGQGTEIYRGEAAYLFLLQVSTGLQSELQGETDIFGQLKEAWRDFSPGATTGTAAWFSRLFEDTKEIRAQYLQNIGGASYGSLARKLLPEHEKPVLLVGAGAIAQAIGPWLADRELWLLNRTPERAGALAEELIAKGARDIHVIDPADAELAWKSCRHAVVCVPLAAENEGQDRARVAAWNGSDAAEPRVLLHLGAYSHAAGAWEKARGFVGIDRLFALKENQETERTALFAQARKACAERAQLRFLPGAQGKVSLAHGWEDLLVFA